MVPHCYDNCQYNNIYQQVSTQTTATERQILTLKNCRVVPEAGVPYLMVGCLTRSSTDSMGFTMRFMVRKAARLAV